MSAVIHTRRHIWDTKLFHVVPVSSISYGREREFRRKEFFKGASNKYVQTYLHVSVIIFLWSSLSPSIWLHAPLNMIIWVNGPKNRSLSIFRGFLCVCTRVCMTWISKQGGWDVCSVNIEAINVIFTCYRLNVKEFVDLILKSNHQMHGKFGSAMNGTSKWNAAFHTGANWYMVKPHYRYVSHRLK